MKPSLNPDVPVPGRTWYDSAWRTDRDIENRRERARERSRRRRLDPEFVKRENAQARERMRGRTGRVTIDPSGRRIPWTPGAKKPTPAQLREAATIEAVLELVEESIRDDARRYVWGEGQSLDAPFGAAPSTIGGVHETLYDFVADPDHWREPGYEAA